MTLYRTRPYVVEAFQWRPGAPIPVWARPHVIATGETLVTREPDGDSTAQPGDYVIRGPNMVRRVDRERFETTFLKIESSLEWFAQATGVVCR